MKTGLLVSVYRSASGDTTAGGVSSQHNHFTLIDREVEGPFEANDERPELNLVRRTIGGQLYLHATPPQASWPAGKAGPMFGGNFIHTSDSRFGRVSRYPIPIHDRFE